MGVIENKVFLSMEDTIARRARKVVSDKLSPLIEEAGKLIEQGMFDAARDIINRFDVSQELLELEGFLRTKYVQGAVFGSSQLTEPEQSIFMEQPHLIDPLENVITQFYGVINTGMVRVQAIALKFLRTEETSELEAITVNDGVIKSFGGHDHGPVEVWKGELANLFNKAVDGNMNALVDIGANLTTSRVISYGFLVEARSVGLLMYEVSEILDERTCPACEIMHGQTFEVEKAFSRTETILGLTDPNAIKAAAPFPRQDTAGLAELRAMSSEDLQAAGFDTPPYHPFCRGILVEVGRESGEASIDIRPLRPGGRAVQRPATGPAIIQPPKPATNLTAPPVAAETPFSTATNHFRKFNDPTITVDKVVAAMEDAEIAKRIKKVTARIRRNEGRETATLHRDADGTWTKARKKKHRKIIREILTPEAIAGARPVAGESPTFTIFGGRAGSGKGALSKTKADKGLNVVDETKTIILDSDAIKALLPGYQGWNAFLYHEESSYVMKRIMKIARRLKLNVVVDGTMSKMGTITRNISDFKAVGYEVDGYYMFVPPQESARRAILRWRTKKGNYKGRYVPTEIALGMIENEAVWDAVQHEFRKWRFYDNQVIGGTPKLMAEGLRKAAEAAVAKLEDSFEPTPVLPDASELILGHGPELWDNDMMDVEVTEEQTDEDIENLKKDIGDDAVDGQGAIA